MKKTFTGILTGLLLCTAGCVNKPVPGAEISTEVPVFSMPSGIYEQPVKLELSSENHFDIYYTTDGSVPTKNSRKYRRAITLEDATGSPDNLASEENGALSTVEGWHRRILEDTSLPKANILRAACIDSQGNSGPVVTKTYWVGQDLQERYGDVPLLSAIADPKDLLDYDTGIMAKGRIYDEWKKTEEGMRFSSETVGKIEPEANFSQHGREWERPVSLTMFDSDGTIRFEADAGIRIRGGHTRSLPQKSFNIYFRKDYGGILSCPLFEEAKDPEDRTITEYRKFALRNGGNDAMYLKFRDNMIQQLLKDRVFETQESYPVILFLNGEYWGVYAMTETYDDQYFESHYGVDRDNVIIIEEDELDEGEDEDILLYEEFKSYADKDLTDPEVWKAFSSTVDTENMAEYFAAEIYFGNNDFAPDKNIRLWRVRTPGYTCSEDDGRWRFLLYDTEYSTDLYKQDSTSAEYDHFAAAIEHFPVFSAAMRNTEFRELFLDRIREIGSVNFAPERTEEVITALAAQYRPLMQDHFLRFDGSYKYWDEELERVRQYFKDRYDLLMPKIEAALNTEGEQK